MHLRHKTTATALLLLLVQFSSPVMAMVPRCGWIGCCGREECGCCQKLSENCSLTTGKKFAGDLEQKLVIEDSPECPMCRKALVDKKAFAEMNTANHLSDVFSTETTLSALQKSCFCATGTRSASFAQLPSVHRIDPAPEWAFVSTLSLPIDRNLSGEFYSAESHHSPPMFSSRVLRTMRCVWTT